MALRKLKLTNCKLSGKNIVVNDSVEPFEVVLNPDNYSINSKINYNHRKVEGQVRFFDVDSDLIKLPALILDVTGAIPGTAEKKLDDLIRKLKQVVFVFDGTSHETPVVKLEWGPLCQYARLSDINVQYELFAEDGTPLRAKVELSFQEFKTIGKILAEKNKQSPDMTHFVEVKAGDTLPLMCFRIYNDASYYLEVAKANGLSSFRRLKMGSFLYFPPLLV